MKDTSRQDHGGHDHAGVHKTAQGLVTHARESLGGQHIGGMRVAHHKQTNQAYHVSHTHNTVQARVSHTSKRVVKGSAHEQHHSTQPYHPPFISRRGEQRKREA